jgi:hypothetical protein
MSQKNCRLQEASGERGDWRISSSLQIWFWGQATMNSPVNYPEIPLNLFFPEIP